jgi:hypothetical protein
MGQYGQVAIKAAQYIADGEKPRAAWEIASCEVFTPGSAMQKKGCPRNAFLGLYGDTGYNARYAQTALKILKDNPGKAYTEAELWNLVIPGKAYNQQMDVVLSLFNAGLI